MFWMANYHTIDYIMTWEGIYQRLELQNLAAVSVFIRMQAGDKGIKPSFWFQCPATFLCSEPVLNWAASMLSLTPGKVEYGATLYPGKKALHHYLSSVSGSVWRNHVSADSTPPRHLRLFRQYPASAVHGDCSPVQSTDSVTSPSPQTCVASI